MTGQLFLAVNNAFVGLLHACETVFTSTGSLPYWISGVVFCFAVKQIVVRSLGGSFSGLRDDKVKRSLPDNKGGANIE